MVESSIVLYCGAIIGASVGWPGEVEFDFDAVWEHRKTPKFEGSLLEWVHVHPIEFGTSASDRDIKCAKALSLAFGEIGKFTIVCFSDEDLNNVDGSITRYRLVDGQLMAFQTGCLEKGDYRAFVLKAMSYGRRGRQC